MILAMLSLQQLMWYTNTNRGQPQQTFVYFLTSVSNYCSLLVGEVFLQEENTVLHTNGAGQVVGQYWLTWFL
jgi:hypothetical protein